VIAKRLCLLEKLNMAAVQDIVASGYKDSFHERSQLVGWIAWQWGMSEACGNEIAFAFSSSRA
jgi:hypothetical protein